MKFFINLLKEIKVNRVLIYNLAKNDFRVRFAGSYLGIVWGFIQPLITLVLYWFVFQIGFKSGTKSDVPYILWLIAGIVPWFFFSEAWASATSCLYDYSFLVKKVVFKVEILPIIKITSALFVHLFFIDLLYILFAAYGYAVNVYNLQMIYYLFCGMLLVYSLALITSSLAVFLKDVNQVVGVILQIFFWTIPIVWGPESFPDRIIMILKFNPLYYVVEGYRDAMINHIWFWEKPIYTAYFWVVLLLTMGIGSMIYRKLKIHFADVL